MQNWWIAVLEHLGLITQEEAQHISNELKVGIHRENYDETYREVQAILDNNKIQIEDRLRHVASYVSQHVKVNNTLKDLEATLATVEAKVVELEAKLTATQAKPPVVKKSLTSTKASV